MTKGIEIEHTDGAGMFLPGELPSSCQIRGGYFKGAMFPFDFRLFANQVAHNSIVPDAWGDMVDVEKEERNCDFCIPVFTDPSLRHGYFRTL